MKRWKIKSCSCLNLPLLSVWTVLLLKAWWLCIDTVSLLKLCFIFNLFLSYIIKCKYTWQPWWLPLLERPMCQAHPLGRNNFFHPQFHLFPRLSLFLAPSPVWGKRWTEKRGPAVCPLPAGGAGLFLLLWRLPGGAAVHAAEVPAAGEQRAHRLPWETAKQVWTTQWYRRMKNNPVTPSILWKKKNRFSPPVFSRSVSTSVVPAMKRFALGFFYLVIFAVFSGYYQDSYFATDEYEVRLCPDL